MAYAIDHPPPEAGLGWEETGNKALELVEEINCSVEKNP